ncbi:uncharacterized protein PV06_07538 [Exophiala oligosperma]|uniref:FAD-binding domain-containing protein n=1 Tax=Exophiala oligosperma TaxID=215243 RepID=A0A0D2AJM4_9EURO|nr:uncharacterized protein PV06_07538 [Exophiala oligosperma]KIW40331.1 hypothetical protein PV06_07538 [Exophiala oligosperma]
MGDVSESIPNGTDGDHTPSLRVLIVGGGIGGLSTAIALRHQGHEVHVFEQASSIRGTGYGIHLAPNGVGLLRLLGYNPETGDAVPMNNIRFFKHTGDQFGHEDRKLTAGRWQNEWLLASRVELLGGLLQLATTVEGKGDPAIIHLSSKIRAVDPEEATIELEDGSSFHGDVVIGADGVYSRARDAITKTSPYPSSHNCFRMMFSRKDLEPDPSIHIPTDETMDMIYSPHTKTIIYTTLGNTKYNCVVTHKSELTEGYIGDPKEKLLELCEGHDAKFVNLFRKADPATLKVWPLYDMDMLSTFAKSRLALIGDAAHPFTPHLAQGAVMAMEDAVSLGVMLSGDTKSSEVPERLQLFNKARHERGTFIQKLSLVVGGDRVQEGKENNELSVRKHLDMALSHDEHHASSQILREWQWKRAKNPSWLQPTVFGPFPTQSDSSRRSLTRKTGPSTVIASIVFKTSATLLRNLFPSEKYSFEKSDTVAVATLSIRNHRNVDWLAGGTHDSLVFSIHGVQYNASEAGEPPVRGSYCPIMFDNLSEAVVAERERYGLPAVHTDIVCTYDTGHYQARLSWRGTEWAALNLHGLVSDPVNIENDENVLPPPSGTFVHRYMPAVGEAVNGARGKQHLDAEYDVYYPESDKQMVESSTSRRATTATIEIKQLDLDTLPTLHHIVARLAELPIFEIVEARVSTSDRAADWSTGSRLG